MQDEKNILAQPNKFKWRDNPPKVTPEEMRAAMASAREADKFECECWNTKCPNFGDCRRCVVYEMCLNRFPTCQRDLLEKLKEHYLAHSGDKYYKKGVTQIENGQKMLFDFIIEHTQDGKQEAMKAALKEHFRPPQQGNFDPDAFKRGIEIITSMLKPEAVAEFHKMMNPFDDMGKSNKPPEIKNVLKQPNRYKWRDNTPTVSKDEMRKALAYAEKAHEMKCDCWNTHCVIYGDCKKCIVFHLYMGQFPTCQRSLLGDLEEHYIIFSRDK